MPAIGEIRHGKEIGLKVNRKIIWQACKICGRERWVELTKGRPTSERCLPCANHSPEHRSHGLVGEKAHTWKGGRYQTPQGYVRVWVPKESFFFPMTNQRHFVLEHRLVMAKHLNRCLLPWEIVHHTNGMKDDNRLENLRLVKGHADHLGFTVLKRENKRLQKRIEQLEAELKRVLA